MPSDFDIFGSATKYGIVVFWLTELQLILTVPAE